MRIQQMKYVCNLSKKHQLMILEKMARELRDEEFPETVEEIVEKILGSKVDDLAHVLEKPTFTPQMALSVIKVFFEEERFMSDKDLRFALMRLGTYFDTTLLQEDLGLHFCTHCKQYMKSGYSINGDEFYCSDDCLHEHYTREEYLALYTGVGYQEEDVLRMIPTLSQSEIDQLHEENNPDIYWTEWEY